MKATCIQTRSAWLMPRPNRIAGLICRFSQPREFAKSPSIRTMDGRGGGDRTHDLRLKRPLLYH